MRVSQQEIQATKYRFENSVGRGRGRRWDEKPRTKLFSREMVWGASSVQLREELTHLQKVLMVAMEAGSVDIGSRREKGGLWSPQAHPALFSVCI